MEKIKTIINIRVEQDVMDKISSLIDAKLPEVSGVKMDAAGLVLTEMLNKFFEKSDCNCNCEDLTAEIEQLKGYVDELKRQNDDLVKDLQAAISWQIPAKLGAVVVNMIKDQDSYADIKTPEQACDWLLNAYWRRGLFIADQSDIDEYIEATHHEFGTQRS